MTTTLQKPLGQILLGKGHIGPDQLDLALVEQRRGNHQRLLGEILVELRHCGLEQIVEALAEAYDIPFARISPRVADPKVVTALPRAFIEKHGVLPLFLVDDELTVAVSDLANVFLIEEIRRVAGRPVHIVAATADDIGATLRDYLPQDQAFADDHLSGPRGAASLELMDARGGAVQRRAGGPAAAAVDKLANGLLYSAISEGATHICLEPAAESIRVRYRLDGRLADRPRPPAPLASAVMARLADAAGIDIASARPQNGWTQARIGSRLIEIRVSCIATQAGPAMTAMLRDTQKSLPHLEQLGFGYDTLKQWRRMIHGAGLLLVAGPAGNGRRTTLYSSIHQRVAPETSICALEDSARIALDGVQHIAMSAASESSWGEMTAAMLEQAPDVIMLSDLPDAPTARAAVRAALEGKLVIAGLLATDSASAVMRLLNLGVEPDALGAALSGALAQRAIRKLCQSCRQSFEPSPAQRKVIDRFAGSASSADKLPVPVALPRYYRSKGCPTCHGAGYAGRVGIFELLAPDERCIDRISRRAPLSELRDAVEKSGLRPLRADGIDKVKAGVTSLDELLRMG